MAAGYWGDTIQEFRPGIACAMNASAPAITIKRRRIGRSSMRVLLDKPLWREIADMKFLYILSTFSYQKMNEANV